MGCWKIGLPHQERISMPKVLAMCEIRYIDVSGLRLSIYILKVVRQFLSENIFTPSTPAVNYITMLYRVEVDDCSFFQLFIITRPTAAVNSDIWN